MVADNGAPLEHRVVKLNVLERIIFEGAHTFLHLHSHRRLDLSFISYFTKRILSPLFVSDHKLF